MKYALEERKAGRQSLYSLHDSGQHPDSVGVFSRDASFPHVSISILVGNKIVKFWESIEFPPAHGYRRDAREGDLVMKWRDIEWMVEDDGGARA